MEWQVRQLRIFGDSIMKGVTYDKEGDRYVSLPQQNLAPSVEVTSSAMFGCTVTKGKQLLERALAKGLGCDTVLLEFGGNDCDYRWDQVAAFPSEAHESNTPLELFESTLRSMVNLLKARKVRPLLMSLPPINSRRYLDHICRNGLDREAIISWLGTVENIGRHQELFSLRATAVAAEIGIPLIDVRSGFLSRRDCEDLICADGIHPNERGNALIWTLLREELLERRIA